MKGLFLVWVGVAFFHSVGFAQNSTTGGLRGKVRDEADGSMAIGATVEAQSPSLQGSAVVFTDENGRYFLSNLPPGDYSIRVEYAGNTLNRTKIVVRVGAVGQVDFTINSKATKGEVIEVKGRPPIVDQASTKLTTTITSDVARNIPMGRTMRGTLDQTSGTQDDDYGTSFSGSTSVENQTLVDGLSVTDPGFGLLNMDIPNEFVQETELITGGYSAEFGRSTGGVVNVITKSGSNKFEGSVFSAITPGATRASEQAVPRAGSAIDRHDSLDYTLDVGAEVGGPIVEDKLWFYAGIAPRFYKNDVARLVNTLVDEDGDGVPDVDGSGFSKLREVARTNHEETTRTVFYTGKLTGAVNDQNRGAISIIGSPTQEKEWVSVLGTESAGRMDTDTNIVDGAAKWTSQLFNNKTEINALVGVHYEKINESPGAGSAGTSQYVFGLPRPLSYFAAEEDAFGGVPAECMDSGVNDPFVNCPTTGYATGGIGLLSDSTAQRNVASLSLTQRFNLGGFHVAKIGMDVEEQRFDTRTGYTGQDWFSEQPDTTWFVFGFNEATDMGAADSYACDLDGDGEADDFCHDIDAHVASTKTRNFSAFFQDSYSPVDNVTINAGLRWERQNLQAADEVVGLIDQATGKPIKREAFHLDNFAPRLGATYDWTNEGRSKLFAHWGRFYESIPMDINVRAFGGEVTRVQLLGPCTNPETGEPCDNLPATADPLFESFFDGSFGGGGTAGVASGLAGQYMDEIVVGTEYEIFENTKVGASYIRRDLGRVIEDVSPDNGVTFLIANPGEVDEGEVNRLREQAKQLESDGMPEEAAKARNQANLLEGVGKFDKPTRLYQAMLLSLEQHFFERLWLNASYTFSKLEGNYPGLYSPDTLQLDPNFSSMYDLPELMTNRYGRLPADRPHQFKLDGYYLFDVAKDTSAVVGSRLRWASGTPISALGAHESYGTGESFILPRGTIGRTPSISQFDLHVAARRKLSKDVEVELFCDVFNLFNQQRAMLVDQNYTFEPVKPIGSGGQAELERLQRADGSGPAIKNPNFGNPTLRQAPLSMRFGARVTF